MFTSVKMLSGLFDEPQTEPDIQFHPDPEMPAYVGTMTEPMTYVTFTASRAFEPGDVIEVSMSLDSDGTYRMNDRGVFEKIA